MTLWLLFSTQHFSFLVFSAVHFKLFTSEIPFKLFTSEINYLMTLSEETKLKGTGCVLTLK